MRIGIYTEIYRPVLNGVVVSVEAFRKNLTALGHEVFVFTPGFMEYGDPRIVTFHSCRLPTDTPYRLTLPFRRARAPLPQVDVIHAQSPFMTGLLAWRHARGQGAPLVFTYHTRLVDYSHYIPLPRALVRAAMVQTSRLYGNMADRVVAPSQPIRDLLRSYGVRSPIEVLPTPASLTPSCPQDVQALRERHGLRTDERLLLNVGRLAQEKNLETLLEAFASARAGETGRSRLALIGDGPEHANLSRLVARLGLDDAVIFAGRVERSEIASWYEAADLFVFTSRSETQGLVLNEALQMGLPVLAIAEGGVIDVVRTSAGARGVDSVGDPALQVRQYSDALHELLASPEPLQCLRDDAARQAGGQDGDLQSAQRLAAIYQAAILDYQARPGRRPLAQIAGWLARLRP